MNHHYINTTLKESPSGVSTKKKQELPPTTTPLTNDDLTITLNKESFKQITSSSSQISMELLGFGCQVGSLDLVSSILDVRRDLLHENYKNTKLIPLSIAIFFGHIHICKYLRKIDKVETFTVDNSPIFIAAMKGHTEILGFLLEDLTHVSPLLVRVDRDGYVPLSISARNGPLEVFKILFYKQEKSSCMNVFSELMIREPLMEAIKGNQREIILFLLQKEWNKSTHEFYGHSILSEAVASGNIELCKTLIGFKKPMNVEAFPGNLSFIKNSPLIMAVKNDTTTMLELLFQNGADVNNNYYLWRKRFPSSEILPLVVALENKKFNAFWFLLKHPATLLHDPEDAYIEILYICAMNHYYEIAIEFLEIFKKNFKGQQYGVLKLELTKTLIKLTKHPKTPIKFIKLLIKHGACAQPPNLTIGGSPLHFAIKNIRVDICDFLIKNGADVNLKFGEPPILTACKIKSVEILRLLIKRGVKLDEETISSPLLYFASCGTTTNRDFQILQLIIKNSTHMTRSVANRLKKEYVSNSSSRVITDLDSGILDEISEFAEKRRINTLKFFLCVRGLVKNSVFSKEYLPFDLFKVILFHSELLPSSFEEVDGAIHTKKIKVECNDPKQL